MRMGAYIHYPHLINNNFKGRCKGSDVKPIYMKTKIISINNQRMSSLEIAKLCGKNHKDVMRAIRNMEPAWEKTAQGKFSLGSLQRP
jgi:hypothetical protein